MLSPGKLHERVPRQPLANLHFRRFLLRKASRDRALQRALFEACRRDILFYINTFVYQFNGKKRSGQIGPFVTWDFQDEAVREILSCVEQGRDVLLEKSRDMGASWLCLIIMSWFFLFHPWKNMLCISRNEKAVESGDPDCLFWKLDFILGRLPDFLKGGYTEKTGRKKLSFSHPNGSSIYGQASTGSAGVGGKCFFMFLDEFSQIKEGHEVLHRTSDTTDCRIFNGTHLGLDTAFYELSDPSSVAGSFIRKVVMHWTQHPEKRRGLYRSAEGKVEVLDKQFAYPHEFQFVKDGSPAGGPRPGLRSPWYDDQCARKGNARAIAMDLDINPSGSVSQFFDALVIRHLIAAFACPPLWEGELDYDPIFGKPRGMNPRPGGLLKLWTTLDDQARPPVGVYVIGADVSQGTGATPSCASVLNAETGEKVAEYENASLPPEDFGTFLVALAWMFKSRDGAAARLCYEKQGPGLNVTKRVWLELGFRNVYCGTDSAVRGQSVSAIPGWNSNQPNKLALLNEYQRALRTRQCLNRSKRALEDTLSFKYNSSGGVEHARESTPADMSAARYNHGDLTMADAQAWMLAADTFKGRKKEEERVAPLLSLEWRRQLRERQSRDEVWA